MRVLPRLRVIGRKKVGFGTMGQQWDNFTAIFSADEPVWRRQFAPLGCQIFPDICSRCAHVIGAGAVPLQSLVRVRGLLLIKQCTLGLARTKSRFLNTQKMFCSARYSHAYSMSVFAYLKYQYNSHNDAQ